MYGAHEDRVVVLHNAHQSHSYPWPAVTSNEHHCTEGKTSESMRWFFRKIEGLVQSDFGEADIRSVETMRNRFRWTEGDLLVPSLGRRG
jgi:hypothetical protein